MKFAISIAALAAVAASNAAALYDNTDVTDGQTIRDNDTPAFHFTNTNAFDVTINHVAFLGTPDSGATQNFTFFLADDSGNILSQVVQQITSAGHGLYGADVDWKVEEGQKYFIGAAFDGRNNRFDYRLSYPTQNGLMPDFNGNFTNALGFEGTAGADMDWQLNGGAVPEPASMAALGLGVAALIRRRRASK